MSQTQTNIKYKYLKKTLENMGYNVAEWGNSVSTINAGSRSVGVISHRKHTEVIVDDSQYCDAPRITQIAKDVDIPCRRDRELYDAATECQIENLRDEVASLREKLSQKITV